MLFLKGLSSVVFLLPLLASAACPSGTHHFPHILDPNIYIELDGKRSDQNSSPVIAVHTPEKPTGPAFDLRTAVIFKDGKMTVSNYRPY